MKKTIAISLSPNTTKEDVFLALMLLLSPWKYFQKKEIIKLEGWFQKYFRTGYAVSFDSGRSGLFALLYSLGVTKGDEVIMQAFTCIAVPNAVIAMGAMPIYADITNDFTIDPQDLERKITKKTKVIIVQHTFGIPSHMDEISAIAKKYNILLIEDVAHTIGGTYHKKALGTFGIASFFSFGRDKAFSSVNGGMVITSDISLGKKLKLYQKQKMPPSYCWTVQQLLHPIAFAFILPLYHPINIGKVLLVMLQKLQVLSIPIDAKEKVGIFLPQNVRKFSNPLAILALSQLQRIKVYNTRRKEIAVMYQKACKDLFIETVSLENAPLLRFPILVNDRESIKAYFRTKGIYLGDWYVNVIDPKEVDVSKVMYKRGSCTQAEIASKKVINLPTMPKMTNKEVEYIITVLKEYVKLQRN